MSAVGPREEGEAPKVLAPGCPGFGHQQVTRRAGIYPYSKSNTETVVKLRPMGQRLSMIIDNLNSILLNIISVGVRSYMKSRWTIKSYIYKCLKGFLDKNGCIDEKSNRTSFQREIYVSIS